MSLRARVAPAAPAFTVAEVLRVGLPDYAREHRLPPHHWRVLRAITACRTTGRLLPSTCAAAMP